MTSHEPDNLFNEEFDQLLYSLAENETLNGDNSMGDLVSLFEDNFSPEERKTREIHSERTTLSSLPSQEEIQDIFRNDFSWEEDNTTDDFHTQESDISGTLAALFSTDDRLPTVPSPSTIQNPRSGDWDELEQLLADEPRYQLPPSIDYKPHLEIKDDRETAFPLFYDSLEELKVFLEEIPQERTKTAIFAELEALLETSPSLPMPQTSQEARSINVSLPSTTAFESSVEELDDEFKDLEKLLEETNQAMGGSPGISLSGGQRLQPRTTKVKTFEHTMRVPIKQLDNLSNLIGELVVKRNRLEQDQERLRHFLDNLLNQVQSLSDVGGRMQDLYERTLLEGALLASRNRSKGLANLGNVNAVSSNPSMTGDLDALEMDRFTDFHLLSQEMIELIVRVRESASDIQFVVDETDQVARTLRQVTTQLQEGMTKSRMVPFAQTADRLPRAIREISIQLNKQAKLQVEGRDALIDKMILEHLNSPMTHLVNNAITHGIESPAERTASGKPAVGTITVRAFLQGNQTVIAVADDGAGIDHQRVKAKAIEKGLITSEEAKVMTAQDVYDLLFHPGFSTQDKADDFAGRGVGLDVVRTSLSEVRGTVSIDSTLGKGTSFTIRLPLTLSICKALCCLSHHARLAFAMDGVEDMKDFTASDIKVNEEGQKCIPWSNTLLPIYSLGDLLSFNRQISRSNVYGGKQEDDIISIVILRSGGYFLAVQVDQVLGEQEIVIKQIEGPVPKPPGIAGATVLGDGTVMPIGDVLELIEIAQGRLRTDHSTWRKPAMPNFSELFDKSESTVLIVDDSITVRELLSLSFGKAGYRVEQARDGQEAWEKLRSGLPCDIVFCDIEMPRMNGLELLANLQKDPKLAEIPVALLTSRGAERHRKVAAKLGASGYFTKPYTETDLLDAARRMIAGEVLLSNSIKVTQEKNSPTLTPATLASDETLVEVEPTNPLSRSGHLVLIVDDSVMVREMLAISFSKAAYRIEQARDGQEAWDKLRSGLKCDLILCDIEMPRMNGLELLSRLQEDDRLSEIPIAMITSRGAQKMQNLAAERGAKGYFVKPYIEDILLDAARRLIDGEVLLTKDSKAD